MWVSKPKKIRQMIQMIPPSLRSLKISVFLWDSINTKWNSGAFVLISFIRFGHDNESYCNILGYH
jgi:hypothetical protein